MKMSFCFIAFKMFEFTSIHKTSFKMKNNNKNKIYSFVFQSFLPALKSWFQESRPYLNIKIIKTQAWLHKTWRKISQELMASRPGLFIQGSIADPPLHHPSRGQRVPGGWVEKRSVCLTGCWKGAGRGASSCQPACYCEGAVPRKSTHLLSDVTASFCTLLCLRMQNLSRLALQKWIVQDSSLCI